MTLNDLVAEHFKRVGIPETEIRLGYASHFEQKDKVYPNVLRMGRAWNNPPKSGLLERDKIGTRNLGLPPLIATIMQELRDSIVNPENYQDVQAFQRGIAQVTQLVTPLILTDALHKKYDATSQAEVECGIKHLKGELTASYEEALANKIGNIGLIRDYTIETVSGYKSSASIPKIGGVIEEINMRIVNQMNDHPDQNRPLRVAFLAIHRGGILPSLVAADLAEKMGCEPYIIGVDAKRRTEGGAAHQGKVVDIDLKKPDGYEPSRYSQLVSEFYVFPKQYEKPDILMVIDPMLATGLSSKKAIEGCLQTLELKPSDVYCTSFFAGGYRGLQTLADAGFNVHIVAHDQLPLTKEDYIKPGLGDAGDKMSGIVMGQDVKHIYKLLQSMEHLVEANAVSMYWLESYARQNTGRRLAA